MLNKSPTAVGVYSNMNRGGKSHNVHREEMGVANPLLYHTVL